MYLSSHLIKEVLDCGASAARRSRRVSLAQIWEQLAVLDPDAVRALLTDALTANLNTAVLAEEQAVLKTSSIGKARPAIGVDGSQIYPRPEQVKYAYVSAVAYPYKGKPLYQCDFVDFGGLIYREVDRDDLLRLLRLADNPKSFTDLWRSSIELDAGLEALRQYPDHVLFMDGPLIPPKTRGSEQNALTDRWTDWLLNIKKLNGIVAGIVSGPSSTLLATMIAIGQNSSIWKARHARENVSDRTIMGYGLGVGERSAVFHYGSRREIPLRERGAGLDFFFLKPSKDEVMRVKIPQWIGESQNAVDTVHASIMEDCRHLGNYSFVLAAAHFDITIPVSISNDLYERALRAYLSNGGMFALSAKNKIKQGGTKKL